MKIDYFSEKSFFDSSKQFFGELNIPLDNSIERKIPPISLLKESFNENNENHKLIQELYFIGQVNDTSFKNDNEVLANFSELEEKIKDKYDTLLVLGVVIDTTNNKKISKSSLSEITRLLNKSFPSRPVVVLFKYGNYLAIANCERTTYKREKNTEKEKVGKVSLLSDINIEHTHAGHIKILEQLKIPKTGKNAITTFETLYKYWQDVFNVSILNKKFYNDLFNWYLWALKEVEFPNAPEKTEDLSDSEYQEKLYSHKAVSVIRLITRLMFVWFLKEKKVHNKPLIPNEIFDKEYLSTLLEYKDKTGSTYYKAILQNLFFATLNTEMAKDNPESRKFVKNQHFIQGFYRYERFFKDKEKAIELFKDIPFLNGGLFENLDKKLDSKEIRIDCFSDNPKNEEKLKVPDYLFFGENQDLDLNEFYGDKKHNHEKVQGLIKLLESYKFTIDENTPLDEEVALDPELLGKVFENLLASYNPETKSTARKQTGSFYTPREIVNYMVDESLIAYLKEKMISIAPTYLEFGNKQTQLLEISEHKNNQLAFTENLNQSKWEGKEDELEKEIRKLFSYNQEEINFSEEEKELLLKSLNECKILDPACGSGAFPMGVLHKMVHVIHKLDPDNNKFRKMQLLNLESEIKEAKKNNDDKELIEELENKKELIKKAIDEKIIDNKQLDYERKLFLIENCIFGIDIQPIAVQIAKLRFFISLITDQKIDDTKKNLGVNPLPNLETKFVCANTLIGLNKVKEKEQMAFSFENPELTKKKNELKKVREKHFGARTPKTKNKYREEDKTLRQEIAELLRKENTALSEDETIKLANWNPYDQNATSEFFDMEWMFGIKEPSASEGKSGFNIVIGNPPYGINFTETEKRYLKSKFDYLVQRIPNSFLYFNGIAYEFMKNKAVFSYIIPNEFLFQIYMEKARKFFLLECEFNLAINLGDEVFDAIVPSCVTLIKKVKQSNYKIKLKDLRNVEFNNISSELNSNKFSSVDFGIILESPSTIFSFDMIKNKLINKLISKNKSFESYCDDIANGISTSCDSVYIVNSQTIKEYDIESIYLKPTIRGNQFNKFYCPENTGDYVLYINSKFDKNLAPNTYNYLEKNRELLTNKSVEKKNGLRDWYLLFRARDENLFLSPKIIIRQTGDSIISALDENISYYTINSVHNAQIKSDYILYTKLFLAFLNSKLLKFVYQEISQESGRVMAEVKPQRIKQMPIAECNENIKIKIDKLVNQIIEKKKLGEDTQDLEDKIDFMVYKLYSLTYEEVKIVDPEFKLSEAEYNKNDFL